MSKEEIVPKIVVEPVGNKPRKNKQLFHLSLFLKQPLLRSTDAYWTISICVILLSAISR